MGSTRDLGAHNLGVLFGCYYCRGGFAFDNRWVVPYNSYLSLLFNCHINVEVYTFVAIVKYLYKYVYKGHNRAQVDVGPMDAVAPNGVAPA